MQLTQVIGLIAAACTTFSFLPQVIKTWKSKSAADLSMAMISSYVAGVSFWLLYGILIKDTPLILANSIGLVFCGTLLFFKIKYA